MPNYELEDLCETGIPDRLARSRMFRPKKVRPLKEPVSEDSKQPDRQDQLLQKHLLAVADYSAAVHHERKMILLHGTDSQTLEEARQVLAAHFANKKPHLLN